MIEQLLQARLQEYSARNALEQENALHEIIQQYALASLEKAGFFSKAVFHGGTCLRIIFNLPRFSEDLDFYLREPEPGFKWGSYFEQIQSDCAAQGLSVELQERAQLERTVKTAFLKTDSIGARLNFKLPFGRHRNRVIRVKFEIDCNPPAGSRSETVFMIFPRPSALLIQSLPSSFATKIHALLCRKYVKGRDWFDFVWYIERKVVPELPVLASALDQVGPWAGQNIPVTVEWLSAALAERIGKIDWQVAVDDVQRFLPLSEQEGLRHWGINFFSSQIARLGQKHSVGQ